MTAESVNRPEAPWTEAQIVDGDLFALKTNDGWLVARAIDTEVIPKRDTNWPAVGTGVAAGPLQSDGVTPGAVPDTPRTLVAEGGGQEFLYTDREDIIVQVFAGINQPVTRVFYEYPKGNRQRALQRDNLGVPTLTAAAISSWGWAWSGYQSLAGDERRISMLLIPYKISVGAAVFNEDSIDRPIAFDWTLNNIRFEGLNPADPADAQVIILVLKNRLNVVKFNPGMQGFNFSPGFRKIFKVDPVVQKANKLIAYGENKKPYELKGG